MLKPTLQLKLSQQLTMTPQLQQAIRLLQLPVMELQTQIQQALDENVMLEVEEAEEQETVAETPDPDTIASGAEADSDGGSDLDVEPTAEAEWEESQKVGPSESAKSSEGPANLEYADRSEDTLTDHLLWQLELENLDAKSTSIGRAIIDAINDDGYLVDDLDTIRATLEPDWAVGVDEIAEVLERVQAFDPAGIGARSIGECILLQLKQLDASTPGLDVACRIANEHLDLVAEHQYGILKRQLKIDDEALEAGLALIRACHPRPGATVHAPASDYVIPDVFVRRVDGHWTVELNDAMAPKLKVNQLYAGSLGRGEEYNALKAQLQEARWLIRSLEIRNETLLKVALTIVQRQTDFLDHGEEHMKPMVLRDIAEAIEMHESTVSRVTTNKYMHTPRGVCEFRFFFSSHVAGDEGEQSSTAVRAKIRKLVSSEDPEKPLSDNQIVRLLSEDGIKVARRTVAKYREGMKIPASSDRRRSKMAG